MRVVYICLLVLALSLGSFGQSSTFTGIWEVDFPYALTTSYLYICENSDSRATGLFNEQILLIGYVNNSIYSGSFYEGFYDGGCYYGTFRFQLVAATKKNPTQFTGDFVCGDDNSVVSWTANLINPETPTDLECANVANFDTFTIGGYYLGTNTGSYNVDFCNYDSNSYEASYSDGSFDYGLTALEGRIAYGGIKYKPNLGGALPGSSLSYVDINGDLHTIFWAGIGIDFFHTSEYLNNSLVHRYDSYIYEEGTNDNNCNRNNALADAKVYYYFNPLYFQNYYSSSSTLALSLLLILCVVGFMF